MENFITPKEAQAITAKNTVTDDYVEKSILQRIHNAIITVAEKGGGWVAFKSNDISKKSIAFLESKGYKVEFKKAHTLMDKDSWRVSWETVEDAIVVE